MKNGVYCYVEFYIPTMDEDKAEETLVEELNKQNLSWELTEKEVETQGDDI